MNRLTKIGASALCGTLACVSAANAGSLGVKGSAVLTHMVNENAMSGNPIGMNSGITFTGSGELDNGTTFVLTLTDADQSAYSSGNLVLTTAGMGVIGIDQGAGGQGLDRIDDKMPTAWEETNGTGLNTGMATVAGVGGSTNIEWSPSSDMMPDGMSAYIAYTPRAGTSNVNDKATGGAGDNTSKSGWDFVLIHSGVTDGLEVFAGYSNIEQIVVATDRHGDRTQYAVGATYAVGAMTLGYEYTRDNMQDGGPNAVSFYENNLYGVSYQVNDDLTLSAGFARSDAHKNGLANVSNDADSFQVSYTMGGATFVFAQTSVDNGTYTAGTSKDIDGRTVRLSLAF